MPRRWPPRRGRAFVLFGRAGLRPPSRAEERARSSTQFALLRPGSGGHGALRVHPRGVYVGRVSIVSRRRFAHADVSLCQSLARTRDRKTGIRLLASHGESERVSQISTRRVARARPLLSRNKRMTRGLAKLKNFPSFYQLSQIEVDHEVGTFVGK